MGLVHHVVLIMVLFNGLSLNKVCSSNSTRPSEVQIGSIFSFDSIVGRVAKVAIEAAIEDVNSDPTVLAGSKLVLKMQDSNYSGFLGIVEAMRFMEKDTVAIIGPQNAVTAHVISHIANELKTPMLSFSVSDPTLTPLQFPYFFRTTQNDLFQMAAVAEMVEFYGWREVIAIYVDDDHGRNGMAALGDKLAEKRCKISYQAALTSRPTKDEITDVLVKVALTESRIIVAHVYAGFGVQVFSIAKYLGMMGSGYVWIATNWLTTLIDVNYPLSLDKMADMEGVLTLRIYTPDTEPKRKFIYRWTNLTSGKMAKGPLGLCTSALYAYDTVWLIARGIDGFFNQGGKISFSNDSRLMQVKDSNLNLDAMSIFDEGDLLLENIIRVNMAGLTGPFRFTPERDIIRPAYEIINVVGSGTRLLGYWSNYSGLTVLPPEHFYSKKPNRSSSNQKLHDAIWPGQTAQKPRGWVFPNNGRHLRIGVPNRVSYKEFVSHEADGDSFNGYCIDVFTSVLSLLPYAVPYKLIPFGDGLSNPSGTELVRLITTGVYEAAIGDIAIITNRTRMADFTQPYIESGLVVVVPVTKSNSNPWAFLKPFTREMWITTGVFFLVIGAVVWILEHRLNDDFRGPPRKQVVTILWFSFSTLFFSHRENTVSTLGRLVLIIWLFVVLIITSSYTASLTSILTVEQLSSPIKGIESLLASDYPIGYQQGSFAQNYLIEELDIKESRLIPLISAADYAKALRAGPHKGGVAAIVDERAYMELFLSTHCEFSIVGQEFTKAGWGFAFQRDSPLAVDMSTAILKLSENGDLQRIHDKWLMRSACTSEATKLEVDRLQLKSFWGLFVICGLACLLALFIYLVQIVRQFSRIRTQDLQSSGRSLRSGRLQNFLSFVDDKDHEVISHSQGRQSDRGSDSIEVRDKSMNGSRETYNETSSRVDDSSPAC